MNNNQRAGIGIMWASFILALLVMVNTAQAGPYGYSFPPREGNPVVTMDVYKKDGGGGTYRCINVARCYDYVKTAEERGATQYCSKIVIKRNGRVAITRDYERWER